MKFRFGSSDNSIVVSKNNTPSAQSPTDSESEDYYADPRSRSLTTKKQQRRLLHSGPAVNHSHGELRFSTRKGPKVSNYNEDDDDLFDEEEDMLTPNYWPSVPDENVPAIDAVLNHRLREDTSKALSCFKSRFGP